MSDTEKIKVAMVSYSNTIPFQFGLEKFKDELGIELILDVPAECGRRLQNNEVDIALVPVGSLSSIVDYTIVSDFCIGAENQVKTVLLLSQVPLNKIKNVYLDNESRTSVNLIKILAKHYWKTNWNWLDFHDSKEYSNIKPESVVLIGDKAANATNSYKYVYDLATVWNAFTGLPFVFAVWVSKNAIPPNSLKSFNQALEYGVNHIDEAIENLSANYQTLDLYDYLNYCISFQLDDQKKKAMKTFISYL